MSCFLYMSHLSARLWRCLPDRRTLFLLLTAALATPSAALAAQEPATILIRAARLIDGKGTLMEPGTILVAGERIVAVGPAALEPPNDGFIDLGDATILPGLIDLHTHLTDRVGTHWEEVLVTTTPAQAALWGAANALTTLRAGFTTVRDMGPTWPYTDVDLRDIIDAGVLPGPRMQVAGNYVSATGGAGDARQFSIYVDVPVVQNLADGVDAVRAAVRTNHKNGADFTKILATGAVLSRGLPPGAQQYSDAELAVAVEETDRWARFTAAHAHGTEGIKAAIRAGVRTVDHGSMMDDEAMAMLLESDHTWYVPTLYVGVIVPRDGAALGVPEGADPPLDRDDALPQRDLPPRHAGRADGRVRHRRGRLRTRPQRARVPDPSRERPERDGRDHLGDERLRRDHGVGGGRGVAGGRKVRGFDRRSGESPG